MTAHALRVLLFERRIQLQQIADRLGVKRPFVSNVARGQRRTRYVQEAIADALGMPVDAIFPIVPEPLIGGQSAEQATHVSSVA